MAHVQGNSLDDAIQSLEIRTKNLSRRISGSLIKPKNEHERNAPEMVKAAILPHIQDLEKKCQVVEAQIQSMDKLKSYYNQYGKLIHPNHVTKPFKERDFAHTRVQKQLLTAEETRLMEWMRQVKEVKRLESSLELSCSNEQKSRFSILQSEYAAYIADALQQRARLNSLLAAYRESIHVLSEKMALYESLLEAKEH